MEPVAGQGRVGLWQYSPASLPNAGAGCVNSWIHRCEWVWTLQRFPGKQVPGMEQQNLVLLREEAVLQGLNAV